MRNQIVLVLIVLSLGMGACTSTQKLSYFDNLPESGGEEKFTMSIPDYHIQNRDVLYITAKAMTPEGLIIDLLAESRTYGGTAYMQSEASQFLYGHDVTREGTVIMPAVGEIKVAGFTLDEARQRIQQQVATVFKNATVECKLLSFKFTVIGEVRSPGTYINYSNYITVLEAVGRAGGITDYGRRDKLLVIRPAEGGTKTFPVNLQDKHLLANEAYFLLPNDVIIVEPESKKAFNLNLPTYSFILTSVTSAITTTLLLINYFKK